MNKNIIRLTMIAAIAIFAGYNMYQSNVKTEGMSGIALANVEALTQDEAGGWYCVGEFYTCILDEQGRIYGKNIPLNNIF